MKQTREVILLHLEPLSHLAPLCFVKIELFVLLSKMLIFSMPRCGLKCEGSNCWFFHICLMSCSRFFLVVQFLATFTPMFTPRSENGQHSHPKHPANCRKIRRVSRILKNLCNYIQVCSNWRMRLETWAKFSINIWKKYGNVHLQKIWIFWNGNCQRPCWHIRIGFSGLPQVVQHNKLFSFHDLPVDPAPDVGSIGSNTASDADPTWRVTGLPQQASS